MKNAPTDEPLRDSDEELEAERTGGAPSTELQQPSIVAGVGSGALASSDIEPQAERHPDNDGETVEE